ncbi:MAG TPA: hypothetical protein PLL06_03080, partial [Acidobacteriota bacterium]|nr:hypothetical protein [Acidobacteriota bacterium]
TGKFFLNLVLTSGAFFSSEIFHFQKFPLEQPLGNEPDFAEFFGAQLKGGGDEFFSHELLFIFHCLPATEAFQFQAEAGQSPLPVQRLSDRRSGVPGLS